MQQEKLDRRIIKILRRTPKGATSNEIASVLGELPDTVYRALLRLMRRGKVTVVRHISKGKGRPESVFSLVPYPRARIEMGEILRMDDISKGRVKEEEEPEPWGKSLVLEIIEDAVIPNPDFQDKVKDAAQRLTKENPHDLLFRFAEWLLKRYRQLGDEYKLAYEERRVDVAGVIKERMGKFQGLAYRIYNKQLGVPWDSGDKTGKKGPFILNYDFKTRTDKSEMNRNELNKFLNHHVQGDAVLERVRAVPTNPTLAGTDASRQEVWLISYSSPEMVVMRHPTGIVVALALFLSPGNPPRLDAKPEPKEWRRYTLDDALELGLLVPPIVYIDDPDMWKRALEAAMNLRQYVKDYEALFPKPTVPGEWIIDALIRDGRIFPWEHYFSDYVRLTEHGRLVRYSLDKFSELKSRTNDRWEKSLYCGAVKEPRVDLLVPLLLWYMRYGSAESDQCVWPDLEEDRILSGFGLSDQQLASLLFEALRDEDSSDERWVTFQLIRRFYTLAESQYSRLWVDAGSWLNVFKKAMERRQKRGLPTYDDVRTYAELCEGAAVIWFYIDTGVSPSFGPRFEALLPSWALHNVDSVRTVSRVIVQKLASIVASPKALMPYKEVWGGHFDWKKGGIPLLVPTPTCMAHDGAFEVCKDHANQLEGYLALKLIKILRRIREKRASS